jgi:hypothetical protein
MPVLVQDVERHVLDEGQRHLEVGDRDADFVEGTEGDESPETRGVDFEEWPGWEGRGGRGVVGRRWRGGRG